MTHTHPVTSRTGRLGSGWVGDSHCPMPGARILKAVSLHVTQLLGMTSQPETSAFVQPGNTVYREELRTFL